MYDFSKSRVRKNGLVLSKFDLGQELKRVLGYNRGVVYEVLNSSFTYSELKERLVNAVLFNI